MKIFEDKEKLKEAFLELIKKTSCELPKDLLSSLKEAFEREECEISRTTLAIILENVEKAKELSRPICQDTGTNIWYIFYPEGPYEALLKETIKEATVEATNLYYLRPNAVNPVDGKNSGNNLGVYAPLIHLHQWEKEELMAALILKGGGSENVSTQYSLPYPELKAGRDLEGVRRVVLHAVYKAQGHGCSPGVIGVGIGGDRITSYMVAKEQLLRPLHDRSPIEELGKLEEKILKETNELGIGAMGFGGKTTILGVKIGYAHRVPASYFVSIAYICWACRRKVMTITPSGELLFKDYIENPLFVVK